MSSSPAINFSDEFLSDEEQEPREVSSFEVDYKKLLEKQSQESVFLSESLGSLIEVCGVEVGPHAVKLLLRLATLIGEKLTRRDICGIYEVKSNSDDSSDQQPVILVKLFDEGLRRRFLDAAEGFVFSPDILGSSSTHPITISNVSSHIKKLLWITNKVADHSSLPSTSVFVPRLSQDQEEVVIPDYSHVKEEKTGKNVARHSAVGIPKRGGKVLSKKPNRRSDETHKYSYEELVKLALSSRSVVMLERLDPSIALQKLQECLPRARKIKPSVPACLPQRAKRTRKCPTWLEGYVSENLIHEEPKKKAPKREENQINTNNNTVNKFDAAMDSKTEEKTFVKVKVKDEPDEKLESTDESNDTHPQQKSFYKQQSKDEPSNKDENTRKILSSKNVLSVELPLELQEKSVAAYFCGHDKIVYTFDEMMTFMVKQNFLDFNVENIIRKHFGGMKLGVLINGMTTKGIPGVSKFTKLQKIFALTLFLYSKRGYQCLSKRFRLPGEELLQSLLFSKRGEPGFLTEVFHFIGNHGLKDCALLIDSFSLNPMLMWDYVNQNLTGYTTTAFGSYFLQSDDLAKTVMVVMVVSMHSPLKLPIAYFYLDSIHPSFLATVIDLSVKKLYDFGVTVRAITLDGSETSFECLKLLPVKMNDVQSLFYHPLTEDIIAVFIDYFHLLNMLRDSIKVEGINAMFHHNIEWQQIEKAWTVKLDSFLSYSGRDRSEIISDVFDKISLNQNLLETIKEFGGIDSSDKLGFNCRKFIGIVESLANEFLSPALMKRTFWGKPSKSWGHRNSSIDKAGFLDFAMKSCFKHSTAHNSSVKPAQGIRFSISSLLILLRKAKLSHSTARLSSNFFSLDQTDLLYSTLASQEGWLTPPNSLEFKEGMRRFLHKNISPFSTFNYSSLTITNFRSAKRSYYHGIPYFYFFPSNVELPLVISKTVDCMDLSSLSHLYLVRVCGWVIKKLSGVVICPHCLYCLRFEPIERKYDHDYSLPSFINSSTFVFEDKREVDIKFQIPASVKHVVETCEAVYRKLSVSCVSSSDLSVLPRKIIFQTQKALLACKNYPFLEFHHPVFTDDCHPVHEFQLVKLICENYINFRIGTHPLKKLSKFLIL